MSIQTYIGISSPELFWLLPSRLFGFCMIVVGATIRSFGFSPIGHVDDLFPIERPSNHLALIFDANHPTKLSVYNEPAT